MRRLLIVLTTVLVSFEHGAAIGFPVSWDIDPIEISPGAIWRSADLFDKDWSTRFKTNLLRKIKSNPTLRNFENDIYCTFQVKASGQIQHVEIFRGNPKVKVDAELANAVETLPLDALTSDKFVNAPFYFRYSKGRIAVYVDVRTTSK